MDDIPVPSSEAAMKAAVSLEEDLLSAKIPMVDEIADPGDTRTCAQDFVAVAEAYRCAGLLELYRVFPLLLQKRLGTDQRSWADDLTFDSFTAPPFHKTSETNHFAFLSSLALHIIDLLVSIPPTSGTCFLQLILLVIASAELRFSANLDYFDLDANDVKVAEAREFVMSRLQEFARRLPAKPISKMIDLIAEVWRRVDVSDATSSDNFWIDVMIENRWQTIMG
jgi:hypothetical protein